MSKSHDRGPLDLDRTLDGHALVAPAGGAGPSGRLERGPQVGAPGIGPAHHRWVGHLGDGGGACGPPPGGGGTPPRRVRVATCARFAAHEIVDVCVTMSVAEAALSAAGCPVEAAAVTRVFELMESRLLR